MVLFKIYCLLFSLSLYIIYVNCDIFNDVNNYKNNIKDNIKYIKDDIKNNIKYIKGDIKNSFEKIIPSNNKDNKDNNDIIYCKSDTEGSANIFSNDTDLIFCQKKETLTECLKCLENDLKNNKNLVNSCVNELKDKYVCKQIVLNLDRCNNRCKNGCYCGRDGICRREEAVGNVPC